MTIAIILISILGIAALANGVMYVVKRVTTEYYTDEGLGFGIGFWVLGTIWLIAFMCITHFALSEQVVSGVVYNTKNNNAISGKTTFSVRASEDTYVSEENKSSYCLPKDSPYIDLVNKAAQDKSIKVIVTTSKFFKFAAPWTCVDNVKVERR